ALAHAVERSRGEGRATGAALVHGEGVPASLVPGWRAGDDGPAPVGLLWWAPQTTVGPGRLSVARGRRRRAYRGVHQQARNGSDGRTALGEPGSGPARGCAGRQEGCPP